MECNQKGRRNLNHATKEVQRRKVTNKKSRTEEKVEDGDEDDEDDERKMLHGHDDNAASMGNGNIPALKKLQVARTNRIES